MAERKIVKVVEKDYYIYSDNLFADYKLDNDVLLMEYDYDEEKNTYLCDLDVYEPIAKYEFEGIDISKRNR